MPNIELNLANNEEKIIEIFNEIKNVDPDSMTEDEEVTLTIIAKSANDNSAIFERVLHDHVATKEAISKLHLSGFSFDEIVVAANIFAEGKLEHVRHLILADITDDPSSQHLSSFVKAFSGNIDEIYFEAPEVTHNTFIDELQNSLEANGVRVRSVNHQTPVKSNISNEMNSNSSSSLSRDLHTKRKYGKVETKSDATNGAKRNKSTHASSNQAGLLTSPFKPTALTPATQWVPFSVDWLLPPAARSIKALEAGAKQNSQFTMQIDSNPTPVSNLPIPRA